MPWKPARHCIGLPGRPCGVLTRPGPRCEACQPVFEAERWSAKGGRYNGDWRRRSREAIEAHLAEHGPVCPGWERGPHVVDPAELVCDHDVGPLCSPCNGAKAAGFDKRRAGGG